MINNQYIQWISGSNRGQVEMIEEMIQDGQTSKDMVILSGGRSMDMTDVGKKFIVLPGKDFALPMDEINIMFPEQDTRQRMKAGLQSIDDVPRQQRQRPEKKPQVSSFSADLLSRAKRETISIDVSVQLEMPTKRFFDMLNETFDLKTINEVIDLITREINQEEIKTLIKQKILESYE